MFSNGASCLQCRSEEELLEIQGVCAMQKSMHFFKTRIHAFSSVISSSSGGFVACCINSVLLSLAGTQLLSTTMGVKDYVQSEFESVEAEIINANKDLFPGTITFDDFLWAFGILRSRVFPELRGDKLALIPFADLVSSQNASISAFF